MGRKLRPWVQTMMELSRSGSPLMRFVTSPGMRDIQKLCNSPHMHSLLVVQRVLGSQLAAIQRTWGPLLYELDADQPRLLRDLAEDDLVEHVLALQRAHIVATRRSIPRAEVVKVLTRAGIKQERALLIHYEATRRRGRSKGGRPRKT